MFQIAAALGLARDYDDIAAFTTRDLFDCSQGRPASDYVDNVFRNVTFVDDLSIPLKHIYQEPFFQYHEFQYFDGIALWGYFQSEKYFRNHRQYILDIFSPSRDIDDYIDHKYGRYLGPTTTSLHVRRGDYVSRQDFHPVLPKQYYYNALSHVDYTKHVLVFSDDPAWCNANLDLDDCVFVSGEKDYIDMYTMSKCGNNVIANSSFSWWGAWLNNRVDKTVIAPKLWFGPNLPHDTTDLIPEEWTVI